MSILIDNKTNIIINFIRIVPADSNHCIINTFRTGLCSYFDLPKVSNKIKCVQHDEI